MIEIKPGRELDKAVAKAIGWTRVVMVFPEDAPLNSTSDANTQVVLHELNADHGEKFIPRYSTDLNAAFEAAVKLSPTVTDVTFTQKDPRVSYRPVYMCDIIMQNGGVFAVLGRTPALAICAAILKLKEDQ